MNKNSIEMMKKLIEEKKKKGNNTKIGKRAEKNLGRTSKAIRSSNGGGLFDK